MANPYANILPTPQTGGVPYATAFPMPAAEGDLFNQPNQPPFDPYPLTYEQAISAVVEFLAQGAVSSLNNCYVILQTDWGDGNWVDVAWCNLAAIPSSTVPTVFTLFAGPASTQGAFAQTRAVGTVPSPSNSSNAVQMGSRFRFVGKTAVNASSASSSSGSGAPALTPAILVTIRWNGRGLR